MSRTVPLLLVSYFLAFFNSFFLLPYLSLDSILLAEQINEDLTLFIASLIYITPNIAQASTFRLFGWLADKKHCEKLLIFIGYSVGLIQLLILFPVVIGAYDSLLVLLITFICNLFNVAYVPAIKTYLAHLSNHDKGRALGYTSAVYSASFGAGSLAGGILYDIIGIHVMIFIAMFISIASLICLAFIPKMHTIYSEDNSQESAENGKVMREDSQESSVSRRLSDTDKPKPTIQPIFSFKNALIFQILLTIFSSSFFPLYALYINTIGGMGTWFIGVSNLMAAILGVISCSVFGKLLDRKGPNFLYWFGWIAYAVVYVVFLSGSVFWIFVVWSIPAFVFFLSTEFLASQQTSSEKANRNMATAAYSRSIGLVGGGFIGGFITIFGDYYTVMWFALLGTLAMGIFLILKSIKQLKMKNVRTK